MRNHVFAEQTSLVQLLLDQEIYWLSFAGEELLTGWWLVDEEFAEELALRGQIVLSEEEGTWWGRQTADPEIHRDCVIEEIATAFNNRLNQYGKLAGKSHRMALQAPHVPLDIMRSILHANSRRSVQRQLLLHLAHDCAVCWNIVAELACETSLGFTPPLSATSLTRALWRICALERSSAAGAAEAFSPDSLEGLGARHRQVALSPDLPLRFAELVLEEARAATLEDTKLGVSLVSDAFALVQHKSLAREWPASYRDLLARAHVYVAESILLTLIHSPSRRASETLVDAIRRHLVTAWHHFSCGTCNDELAATLNEAIARLMLEEEQEAIVEGTDDLLYRADELLESTEALLAEPEHRTRSEEVLAQRAASTASTPRRRERTPQVVTRERQRTAGPRRVESSQSILQLVE